MPKYTVEKLVDAYVVYSVEIIADDPEQAIDLATDDNLDWQESETRQFDQREFEAFDQSGNSVACTI